jgi:hypothetical protein
VDPLLVLTVLCSAAELFAFCRFVRARVHRLLPWFSVYLLAGFAQSFSWLAGPPSSRGYATAYGLTTPVLIALQFLVFLELWRKLMTRDSGADRATRALGVAIIGASIVLALLTGVDGFALHIGLSRRLLFMWIFLSVRYSATILCITASLLAVCTSLFGRRLPRYVTQHAYLLAAYFGSIAAGYLVFNLNLLSAQLMGALTVGSAAALYVLWGILIPGSAEKAPSTEPVRGDVPHDAEGLTRRVA